MHLPLEIHANAKINLFLNILGQREDGFHELRMVMQSVGLSDRLLIEPGDGEGLYFHCSEPSLVTEDNLVVRAYFLFFDTLGIEPIPLNMTLDKNIPVQAGLGGGSADAAAMLKALNHIMDGALRETTLSKLAAKLGSDVPFFLAGGTCIATGRGEVITPCLPLDPIDVALLTPRHLGISTPEAYARFKEQGRYREQSFADWEAVLTRSSSQRPNYHRLLFNDFEWIIFPEHRILSEAKMQLEVLGLAGVLLSGSGPTLFGLMDRPEHQWPEIIKGFSQQDWIIHQCRFTSSSITMAQYLSNPS